jgi:hypothetical protein
MTNQLEKAAVCAVHVSFILEKVRCHSPSYKRYLDGLFGRGNLGCFHSAVSALL